MAEGALTGVRVVDLTDERAIYAAKLLADLGADVVRPEPAGGDPLRRRGPRTTTDESLWYAFFASGRRFVTLAPETAEGRDRLQRLVEVADIVLTCDGAFAADAVDLTAARARRPALVHVAVSSFGDDGPWRDFLAPDLVAGALGGAVATTGTPDTTPLKTFGELNFMVSGVYAAIAALAALRHARATGEGQRVAVPVHECIASCLEQVLMLNWYGEAMGRGRVLPRQGGTHWSMAFTVMPARNGAIMVTPMPDFDAQLAWLVEDGAHQDLLDDRYSQPENLPLYIARMMQVMREWVADKDPEALFHEAQARHSPYGWVLPLERLADNPQLAARAWWTQYAVGDRTVNGPGAPYRFSATPWQHRDGETLAPDRVFEALGWEQRR
jgi:benzylsuccinate CoA-transferase BbsE subunit/naphthyl-2-methylsuccinate CoA transferase subunit